MPVLVDQLLSLRPAELTKIAPCFGLIESKLRYFVLNVEKEENIESARIWPKPFTKRGGEKNCMTQIWFIGLVLKDHNDEVIQLNT